MHRAGDSELSPEKRVQSRLPDEGAPREQRLGHTYKDRTAPPVQQQRAWRHCGCWVGHDKAIPSATDKESPRSGGSRWSNQAARAQAGTRLPPQGGPRLGRAGPGTRDNASAYTCLGIRSLQYLPSHPGRCHSYLSVTHTDGKRVTCDTRRSRLSIHTFLACGLALALKAELLPTEPPAFPAPLVQE